MRHDDQSSCGDACMTLPGTHLLTLSRRLIDPVAITRVLEPLVADWQREWLAADSWRRRASVRLRGSATFVGVALYCSLTEDVPRQLRRRSWTTMLNYAAFGVLAQSVVLLSVEPSLIGWWIPALLTLSLPFALLPVAMRAVRDGDRGRRHLVRVTLATMLAVIVLHNWAVPHANQAFRQRAILLEAAHDGRTPPARLSRGLRELTLGELLAIGRVPDRMPASPQQISEERHSRLALALMPLVLATLGWHLRRANGNAGRLRIVFWWIFIASTFGAMRSLGMTFERWWHLPREVAVWLPLVLWALSIAVLRTRGSTLIDRSQPVR